MYASKWQSSLIIVKSCWQTVKVSCIALWRSLFGKNTRDNVDTLARWWAHTLLGYLDVKVNVQNPHDFQLEPNQPYIFMSNHCSLYDIPLIYVAMPGSIRMLAKKELFKVPFMGWAMKASEFLFVDRENRDKAIESLNRARDKMLSGIVIWMAPEGTRGRTPELQDFKKGGFMTAIQAGAKIVPISLKGPFDILPAKTLKFQLGQTVDITIHEVVDASKYTLEQREELMAKVRDAISSGL